MALNLTRVQVNQQALRFRRHINNGNISRISKWTFAWNEWSWTFREMLNEHIHRLKIISMRSFCHKHMTQQKSLAKLFQKEFYNFKHLIVAMYVVVGGKQMSILSSQAAGLLCWNPLERKTLQPLRVFLYHRSRSSFSFVRTLVVVATAARGGGAANGGGAVMVLRLPMQLTSTVVDD